MSFDNWTYCTAVVELAPCSGLALDVNDYDAPAEANLEHIKSRRQGRLGLAADRSKSKECRHEVRSRIFRDSTQTDPEYVWGDEGPIND
jgi:hypothetical protein